MSRYEDDTVLLDDDGLTIKSYRKPRDEKRIEYRSIRSFETFETGLFTGRHRLVGINPGKPRNWFHWGRGRSDKRTAISLDVGGWIYPTIVPDDPDAVEEVLGGVLDTR